jgi:hypothetical protein
VQKFMFDTNAYNNLMDGLVEIDMLPEAEYYCTFEQFEELKATKCEKRRTELLVFFGGLKHIELHIETFVLGNAQLGKTNIGDGKLASQLIDVLNQCKKKDNNLIDALIAEATSKNKLTLVTDDECLLKACEKCDIPAIHLQDLVLPTHP